MQLYTVEEHRLAEAIKENATKLVSLALQNKLTLLSVALTTASKGKKFNISESHLSPPELITKIISESHSSRLALARSILTAPDNDNYRARKFVLAIDEIKNKLGLSEGLDHTKSYLRTLVEAEVDTNKRAQEIADILYHLDVATRHIDGLVGFGLIAQHSDEIVSISSDMQVLAQRIRTELGGEPTDRTEKISSDVPRPTKKVREV